MILRGAEQTLDGPVLEFPHETGTTVPMRSIVSTSRVNERNLYSLLENIGLLNPHISDGSDRDVDPGRNGVRRALCPLYKVESVHIKGLEEEKGLQCSLQTG